MPTTSASDIAAPSATSARVKRLPGVRCVRVRLKSNPPVPVDEPRCSERLDQPSSYSSGEGEIPRAGSDKNLCAGT
jgi:hypothetical protein